MKRKGNTVKYLNERNADLMRAYREAVSESGTISIPELMKRIVNSPSKRFWISERHASIVISNIMKGRLPEKVSKTKLEMYMEIFERVQAIMRKYPKWSLSRAVEEVTAQAAPKFYLTPGSANVIISKILKRCREERKRNILR